MSFGPPRLLPMGHFYENEDWNTRAFIEVPSGSQLLPEHIDDASPPTAGGIDLFIYDRRSGQAPELLKPVYQRLAMPTTEEMQAGYNTDIGTGGRVDARFILTETPRTEGWRRNAVGYNFLFVMERSLLSFTPKAGGQYSMVWKFHETIEPGDLPAWGDGTMQQPIIIHGIGA